jgi:hypothetical protein
MSLTFHTVLLPMRFAIFRLLNSIVNYGRSKYVIELNEFDRSIFWESTNANVSISSKTIAVILLGDYLQYRVVYIRKEKFQRLSCPRTVYLCRLLIRFSSIDPQGLDNWLLLPRPITFTVISYLRRGMLYCYWRHSILSEFWLSSWIRHIPNVIELNNYYYSRIW